MTPGICRHCECTETAPCAGGCSWVDDTQTLCSQCHHGVEIAGVFLRVLAEGMRLGGRALTFEALPLARQTPLVMICRAVVEAIRDEFFQVVGSEAATAAATLAQLALFLYKRFPSEMQAAERDQRSIVEVVRGLLERVRDDRIVIATAIVG